MLVLSRQSKFVQEDMLREGVLDKQAENWHSSKVLYISEQVLAEVAQCI